MFSVGDRFGHVSRSPVAALPANGINIVTSTEEAAKQSDPLFRRAHSGIPALKCRIGDLRGQATGFCSLRNWYAMRDHEASQTDVLFPQSLYFCERYPKA